MRALAFLISLSVSYPVFGLGLSSAPLVLPPYPRLPATPTYQLPPYPTLPPVFASSYQPYRAFMPRPRMGNYSSFGSGGGALGLISSLLSSFFGGGMNAGLGGNIQGFGAPLFGSSMYSPSYGPTYMPDYTPTYTPSYTSHYTPNFTSPSITRPYTPPPVATAPVSIPDRMANTAPDVLPPINTAPSRNSPPATAPASPRKSAVRIAPDVLNPAEQRAVQARNNAERSAQNSAAWPTFYRLFKQCAPNCEPTSYDAFAHNRYSCHNQGRAIDLHGMVCGGQVFMAIQDRNQSGPFDKMVRCVQGLGQNPSSRMIVLWHQNNGRRGVTQDHYDHGHFSIGCYNGSYW